MATVLNIGIKVQSATVYCPRFKLNIPLKNCLLLKQEFSLCLRKFKCLWTRKYIQLAFFYLRRFICLTEMMEMLRYRIKVLYFPHYTL